MQKIKLTMPIIVEGKYDKNTLLQIFDATVITTGGFAVFNSEEKKKLIRMLSRNGIILLTDSDGGGKQIRSYLSGIVEKGKLHHVYIPEIAGKEKRKTSPSKAGLLGVEGMTREVLEKVLSPFVSSEACQENEKKEPERMLTKVDLFLDGLSGGADSSLRREELLRYFDLPKTLSANALIEAVNLLFGYEKYKEAVYTLFGTKSEKEEET